MDSQLPDVDENGAPSEKQALLAKERHFAAALKKEALFDAFESAGKETQKEIQWMEALRRKQAVAGAAGKETGLNRWRSPRC
jgi:hypothetical protein